MEQSLERFIRKNGLIAGAFNLVLNPAFAWLGNRDMAEQSLYPAMLIDTAITCLVMSLLISLFVSADTERALRSGTIKPTASGPGLLSRLPARPWRFGLALGGIVALAALPCLMLACGILGVSSLSFASFALFKAVYTPPVAYVVTRRVILRQLSNAAA